MKLYGFWRSGATYRVRIALALKGLAYDYAPINLLKGEQGSPDYLKASPQGLVPALITDEGPVLTQSLAIIAYLEEKAPMPSLLPGDPISRAKARAIAFAIACEAQPFQNSRTQKYLREDAHFDDAAMKRWLDFTVGRALRAVEIMIADAGGKFCVGDAPTIADICLVPQVYAALRFGIDLSAVPRVNEIHERCNALDAFKKAHPDNQPDAPKG
jgi:maleylacetoacetate isomerase